MNAKYTIPTMVLSTTLTACADPIIGEWTATKLVDGAEGTTTVLPYESCYTPYEGYDETTGEYIYGEEECVEISYKMTINDDLSGSFTTTAGEDTEDMNVQVTKDASNEWTIVNDLFTFDCALNGKELECDIETSTYSIFFEK